jgi:HD-GYP domain-containing protein (c-di-GMP phosphodiesterase class II)
VDERGKTLFVLIVAQMSCLATGLFIHNRFVVSSLNYASYDKHWSCLAEQAAPFLRVLRKFESEQDSASESIVQDLTRILHDKQQAGAGHALLVDSQWQVLAGNNPATNNRRLLWAPLPESAQSATRGGDASRDPTRGLLTLPSGRQPAVAYPLGRNGYLVVHRLADTSISPQAVFEPLWHSGLITFVWTSGVLTVAVYLVISRLCDRFSRKAAEAEAAAMRQAESMARMRDAVVFGLAKLTESRDPATGFHLEKISLYSSMLAQAMRRHPKFCQAITLESVRLIEISSILHDIGKVGIEDAVLLKPGRLTDEERGRIQQHTVIGGQCIQEIEQRLGSSNYLQMARQIAYSHHERWDGSGYPSGLAGEEIPLAARIVAVADVYEALSSKRVYKQAMPHEKCVAHIREQAGRHFDPHIVEVFLQIEAKFREINLQFLNHAKPEPGKIEVDAAAESVQQPKLPIWASVTQHRPFFEPANVPCVT